MYVKLMTYTNAKPATGLVSSVRQWPGRPGRVILKTQKMILDAALLNIQHYKVCIQGKVEQSKERNSALPHTSV